MCFRKILKKGLLTSSCLSVSVRMEELSSHWTDFREISYLRIIRKAVEKNSVSLKYDNNNVCCNISPKSSYLLTPWCRVFLEKLTGL